jgi:hypothetical protein
VSKKIRLSIKTRSIVTSAADGWFAAQPKKFFLDGLDELEQRSRKCVELRGGIGRVTTFFNPVAYKVKR